MLRNLTLPAFAAGALAFSACVKPEVSSAEKPNAEAPSKPESSLQETSPGIRPLVKFYFSITACDPNERFVVVPVEVIIISTTKPGPVQKQQLLNETQQLKRRLQESFKEFVEHTPVVTADNEMSPEIDNFSTGTLNAISGRYAQTIVNILKKTEHDHGQVFVNMNRINWSEKPHPGCTVGYEPAFTT